MTIVHGADEHEIESIGAESITPGLELLGPVAFDQVRSGRITEIARWPPEGTQPAEGLVLDRDTSIGLGARAANPGVYELKGIRIRYRKGLRRFDEVDGTDLCFEVSERGVEADFDRC